MMGNNRFEINEKLANNSGTNNSYTSSDDDELNDDFELNFYDTNNLPPSLSVTITQRCNTNNSSTEDSGMVDVGFEIKKTIMVGGDYQASIPKYTSDHAAIYPDQSKLLWSPYGSGSSFTDHQIEQFLIKSRKIYESRERKPSSTTSTTSQSSVLQSIHIRDDEEALYVLLQSGYDTELALQKLQSDPLSSQVPPLWTEEECRNFESGIRCFGKDFYLIHLHKVKNRSVGDLVKFYYLWKKTERYKIFAYHFELDKRQLGLSSKYPEISCPNNGFHQESVDAHAQSVVQPTSSTYNSSMTELSILQIPPVQGPSQICSNILHTTSNNTNDIIHSMESFSK